MSTNRSTIDVPPHVLEYLGEHEVLTLATASSTGLPHAATQVYVNEGLAIYFGTRPGTITGRHIEQNPVVAFTIDEYCADWSKTKGIQGSGEGRALLDPAAIRHVVALFQQKFPFLSDTHATDLSFFRLTPFELQFIDNERAGGETAGQTLGTPYRRSLVYSVFSTLPQQEVDRVTANLESVQVQAGEVIVRQGTPADEFFIIVDGEVEILREEDGLTRSVAKLSRGEFFGEIAILLNRPRTATVRAVTTTTLLSMTRNTFRNLIAQSLATTQDFDRVIQQRLDGLAAGRPQPSKSDQTR
jgi:uncharacterized protein YhbP (UPF0306 family)